MKAEKMTSWKVVLKRMNGHFMRVFFFETKTIVLVGFASTKTGQGQLFFISLDGACGRHSLASGDPQSQTQPTQFSEKAGRVFSIYPHSFLSWQSKHYSGCKRLFYMLKRYVDALLII